ncbi:hydrolase [Marmoricola endophyticus]|uniref:Hydrolase n=1 Tax=Marmoricola endophyticus TaxID=2040280 RepID=A0A917BM30_9ACTN|nr:nitrilase-related carbon-nitrogen hydrolase [Marmoricola endophyticus]GGF46327.1 hydrolase [Marmoricola endophyticus]
MKVALWQCRSDPLQVEGNLARLEAACAQARESGADVLLTPELFTTGYEISPADTERLAEQYDGPTARAVAEISRRTGVAVAYGYPEREGSCVFNAMQVLDGDTVVVRHRKMHLFASIDRDRFTPGPTPPQVGDLRGTPVSGLICFDVEFPESVRAAALAGAALVLVPTANPVGYEPVSTLLVPARAYENGVRVAYANFVGGEGRTTYAGLSVLAGPDGEALTAGPEEETLLVAAPTEPVRRTPHYLRDRRTDLW